ncbi:MAG TPA: fructosamine kinase family protein [Niabella sp.]|nr:fructosamine kinase family protein [Niabella sp.]
MLPQDFSEISGLKIKSISMVSGGDINDAFKLETEDGQYYFLKVNDCNRYPEMFEKEAKGLSTLQKSCRLKVPEVINYGIYKNQQYLMLEWIEKGAPAKDFAQNFGASIAELHQIRQPYFGFEQDNYIGSLQQINTPTNNWVEFYTNYRILRLVKLLYDRNDISAKDLQRAENFCKQLNKIFPSDPPPLLHGDLWSGNYMISKEGYASIYDPAVYYGHREMDIGMSKLFGGFSTTFYDSYNDFYPLEKGWQSRLPFTQLYPLLVHALLFGGHYIQSVREILVPF